jgi:hypothetical protein
MIGMDMASQLPTAEREWQTRKWRCTGVFCAAALWLGAILAYPKVPFIVRWAQVPLFAILIPIFIGQTMRKWRAYQSAAQ